MCMCFHLTSHRDWIDDMRSGIWMSCDFAVSPVKTAVQDIQSITIFRKIGEILVLFELEI